MSDPISSNSSLSVSLHERTRQLAGSFAGDARPHAITDDSPCLQKLRASFETALHNFLDCSAPAEEEAEHNAALEKLQRYARIKTELRHLSVGRSVLAFHAIKDQVVRGPNGKLQSKEGIPLSLLVARLVCEHPELIRLPA